MSEFKKYLKNKLNEIELKIKECNDYEELIILKEKRDAIKYIIKKEK